MTFYDVDTITTAEIAAESDVGDQSVGDNTGNAVTLATLTKTQSEWGSLAAWQSVANNSHTITQMARTYLQSNYAGKQVDLDGIFLTLTNV